MNTTDILASENNEGENLQGDMNFSTNIGGLDTNIGGSGPILQSSIPMGAGQPFEASAGLETTSSTQQFMTGNVMSVGGGVGDNAVDVTYSTKNNQAFAFGAGGEGQTTTTTTTTI